MAIEFNREGTVKSEGYAMRHEPDILAACQSLTSGWSQLISLM
jgi:hypothetical protein